nr:MAG TPA: hypothetical protein [Caudoviricetes sp.]
MHLFPVLLFFMGGEDCGSDYTVRCVLHRNQGRSLSERVRYEQRSAKAL